MKKLLGATWAVLLVAVAWVGCERPLRSVDINSNGPATFALIGSTADSVDVSVRWNASTDPSGIHHYEWMDTLVFGNIVGFVRRQTTVFLIDTIRVPKPPINLRHEHDFYVRAVDNQGNIGQYSARSRWAITRRDNLGPNAPDSIFLDTLINVPIAITGLKLLPESVTIHPFDEVDFCALMLFENGRYALRAIDSTACLPLYREKIPINQRVVSREQQATADSVCVLWSATGGTIGQEPCSQSPAMLKERGLLFNVAIVNQ